MGFRFRKRVRLFKGAWINLSKQGGYLSIGGHGRLDLVYYRDPVLTIGDQFPLWTLH
jgi:hypothetical protein